MNTKLSFNTLVSTRCNELTQTELRIVEYIEGNRESFVNMSTSNLAKTVGVGEASIIRFTKKLGYKGLPELKNQLRGEIEEAAVHQFAAVTSMDEATDSMQKIANQLAQSTHNAISDTLLLQSEETLDKVASQLNEAKHIYFYGIGMSAISALHAKYRFMRIMSNVDALIDNHTLILNSNNVNEGDVVIAISHSGESKDTIDALKRVKERGAATIVISKFERSSLSQHADVILLTGGTSNPYESDSSTITAAQTYVLDLLFHGLVFVNQGRSISKLVDALNIIHQQHT
ncbi:MULTISPECIES: MurR/RpiR family transcriptional regulator [Vibrio]|uniref:MurR/RpiR family transcriptional regulator n=1 Tax=Vibrio TaxID=662 RepID=UPI0021C45032|nr:MULTISPECIES: MurR/RpiR family transcriptional regulator [Vibrio]MDE1219813.1 MurR/RpiR family transcriptional regulator [Vibrio aestuarianus]MDE1263325.1 MurR/RpiR family transcriptional regulator [Vibrio aestuarianus]MDE1295265.1 MurR/RpiR family transcriptional regulator [Vibrio aestuarianus]MDE1332528.1 MurR/RpiR family transcriptional regulator [Vibrio aestuarianus]MDF9401080.1 MurR/RpiR family transcriptional regulator [Vibrio sp. 1180_3]